MRTQMVVSVQVFENGIIVKKQIPMNDMEFEIGQKKITFGEYVKRNSDEILTLKKENASLKKVIEDIVRKDTEWKVETNKVITTILNKLKEMGEIL